MDGDAGAFGVGRGVVLAVLREGRGKVLVPYPESGRDIWTERPSSLQTLHLATWQRLALAASAFY